MHAADIVYFRLYGTISVDISVCMNVCVYVHMCVCVCVRVRSLELISAKGIEPCNADLHAVHSVFLI